MIRPNYNLILACHRLALGSRTHLAGILNITPDSFSDGGKYLSPDRALRQALRLEREGADMIDIGGESSRPGARKISAKEELKRILPPLKKIVKKIKIPISIDTYKYEVAEAALGEGAQIINDIYALGADRRLARLIARSNAAIILMHMRGNPRTMQKNISYGNLTREIIVYLRKAVERAQEAGISKSKILVDPGFGFGKTFEHNLTLLQDLHEFHALGVPLFVGLSRKSFIGVLTGEPVGQRLYGSLAAAGAAIGAGAHILRVHDVRPHREFCRAFDGIFLKK